MRFAKEKPSVFHRRMAHLQREKARGAECDEDEARWDERLKKVAKAKPAPEKPE